MRLVSGVLSLKEVEEIKKEFGAYVKVTVDIEKKLAVIGPELHRDAVPILKDGGGEKYVGRLD